MQLREVYLPNGVILVGRQLTADWVDVYSIERYLGVSGWIQNNIQGVDKKRFIWQKEWLLFIPMSDMERLLGNMYKHRLLEQGIQQLRRGFELWQQKGYQQDLGIGSMVDIWINGFELVNGEDWILFKKGWFYDEDTRNRVCSFRKNGLAVRVMAPGCSKPQADDYVASTVIGTIEEACFLPEPALPSTEVKTTPEKKSEVIQLPDKEKELRKKIDELEIKIKDMNNTLLCVLKRHIGAEDVLAIFYTLMNFDVTYPVSCWKGEPIPTKYQRWWFGTSIAAAITKPVVDVVIKGKRPVLGYLSVNQLHKWLVYCGVFKPRVAADEVEWQYNVYEKLQPGIDYAVIRLCAEQTEDGEWDPSSLRELFLWSPHMAKKIIDFWTEKQKDPRGFWRLLFLINPGEDLFTKRRVFWLFEPDKEKAEKAWDLCTTGIKMANETEWGESGKEIFG